MMNTDKKSGGILRLNLDVTKIDKTALFRGKKGTYLEISVLMHSDADEYGNHGMAVQGIGKDRREAGERGPILGNGEWVSKPKDTVQWIDKGVNQGMVMEVSADDDDDIPF
tara:strand:- start:311 stop:643 length:333 start_codon:yes stop_codon:yes gene_type:complete